MQHVKSNLSSLNSSAGSLWNGQIQNLRSALTELQSAVSTLVTQRNASSVSGVITTMAGVSAAARQLLDTASSSRMRQPGDRPEMLGSPTDAAPPAIERETS